MIIAEGLELMMQIQQRIRHEQEIINNNTKYETSLKAGVENKNAELEITKRLDFLFLDIDSKDPSLGISAPPKSFLTDESLRTIHEIVASEGLIVINLVVRNISLLGALLSKVREIFNDCDVTEMKKKEAESTTKVKNDSIGLKLKKSEFFTIKSSDDTANVILIIRKGGCYEAIEKGMDGSKRGETGIGGSKLNGNKLNSSSSERQQSPSTALSSVIDMEFAIDEWLRSINITSDPLKLSSLINKIKLI